jgi:hypothetical protein
MRVQAYLSSAILSPVLGDVVQLEVIPGVGHFEIASSRASTWPRVRSSIRALLESADVGSAYSLQKRTLGVKPRPD